MITLKTKEVARRLGVRTPYQLAQRLGRTDGIPPDGLLVTAARLWGNKGTPRLETIDRLLDALGCELSELLVHTPNRRTRRRTPPKNGRNGHG